MNAPCTGIMEDAKRFIVWAHIWITKLPIPDHEVVRTIQEFSLPGVSRAIPTYFSSSSFRAEWLDRRYRLLKS